MWPLPVSELFMLGRKTVPKLEAIGIYKIEDLANITIETLNVNDIGNIVNKVMFKILDSYGIFRRDFILIMIIVP